MAEPSSCKSLFSSEDSSRWQTSLDSYKDVLAQVSSSKRRSSSRDTNLALLDNWYQKELPTAVSSRDKPHLTHDELCKIMQWKLTRGKFRPRLTELVKQNSPKDVETITAAAIEALPDLERAVGLATQLRGVGPATASAILCVGSQEVPFMADEAASSVYPSLGKLTYSAKQYLTYARRLQEKARELSNGGEKVWTAHEVELALWSHHHSTKQVLPSGKRKREEEPATQEPLDKPPKKRPKKSNS